jgi:hypothetical protein
VEFLLLGNDKIGHRIVCHKIRLAIRPMKCLRWSYTKLNQQKGISSPDGSKYPLLPATKLWGGSKDTVYSGCCVVMKMKCGASKNPLLNRFDSGNHKGNQNPENPDESEGESQTRQFGDISYDGGSH